MFKNIIAILLIVVGVVAIAAGVWGFSLRLGSEVDPNVLYAARTVLDYADSAVGTADSWLSDATGGQMSLSGIINNMLGGEIDVTSEWSMSWFAALHALEILLCGIIGVETGLLMFKFGRR